MNTYKKILTFLVVLLACYSGLIGYFIVTSDVEIDFRINWNIFNSILMWPLYIVGLIVSLGMKFTSYEPWTKTEYSDGTVKYERNNDIIEVLFASIVLPLLQYLVIGPIIVAVMIYYPIMAIIYIFGKIFPYLILVFFILTLIMFYKCESKLIVNNNRLYSMPLVGVLFTGVLWLFFILWVPSHYNHPVRLVNIISIAVISIIIVSFVLHAVLEQKKGNSYESKTLSDDYEPSKTSKQFIITYIISFLLVLGIYGFKATASYTGSDSKKTNNAQISHPDTSKYVVSENFADEQKVGDKLQTALNTNLIGTEYNGWQKLRDKLTGLNMYMYNEVYMEGFPDYILFAYSTVRNNFAAKHVRFFLAKETNGLLKIVDELTFDRNTSDVIGLVELIDNTDGITKLKFARYKDKGEDIDLKAFYDVDIQNEKFLTKTPTGNWSLYIP